MSVNRAKPHVFVLPEDRANLVITNAFHLQVDWPLQGQMQVLSPAGGWSKVLDLFQTEHIAEMQKYPHRFMVLVFDFDDRIERLNNAKAGIPEHLTERVFILGALSRPEALRQANLGSYEDIGLALAKDCREETDTIWGHELLRHNANELDRLRQHVRPILFPSI